MGHGIHSSSHAAYNAKIGKGWHCLGIAVSGEGTLEDQINEVKRQVPLLVSEHRKVEVQVMVSTAKDRAVHESLVKGGAQVFNMRGNGMDLETAVARHPKGAAVLRLEDGHILDGIVSQDTEDRDGFNIYQPSRMADDALTVAKQCPGAQFSFAALLHGGSRVFW